MDNFKDRLNKLLAIVDDRDQREKKAEEIRQLTQDFSVLNKHIKDGIPTSHFIVKITGDESLNDLSIEVKDEYLQIKNELVKLWGLNGERIDILDPQVISKELSALDTKLKKLENKSMDALRSEILEYSRAKTLAESFASIPDIALNNKPFEDAYNFLVNFKDNNSQFLKASSFDQRLESWHKIQEELTLERSKMNLDHLKGKIAPKTMELIKKITSAKEVSFDMLDNTTLSEMRSSFPELCRKLRVKLNDD